MTRFQNPFRALSGMLLAVALVATGGAALAQTAPAPSAAAGLRTTPIGRMRISFSVVAAPLGFWERTLSRDNGFTTDTAFAFGPRPTFDYSLNDYVFVGFSPQLILNVRARESGIAEESPPDKALDLLVRVGAHAPIAERSHLYAFLSPGYSIVYATAGDDPAGFVMGVMAGGMYWLTDRLFASADIGYQAGYQRLNERDYGPHFYLRYLLIGLGIGMRL